MSTSDTPEPISVDGRARTDDAEVRPTDDSPSVGAVVRGSVVLETAVGPVEVRVREGTATWADAHNMTDDVRKVLADDVPPLSSPPRRPR